MQSLVLQIPPFTDIVLAVITIGTIYWIAQCLYLLFFHPLAKYPGPLFAAISDFWVPVSVATGLNIFKMLDLHKKHGDVVRIGPNYLSFSSSQALRDIYGRSAKDKKMFLKIADYERPGDIATVRDPIMHAKHKNALSRAFSTTALRDQEDVFQRYCDSFIQNLGRLGCNGEKSLNVEELSTWLTFNVIGDLAFGEPFNAQPEASQNWVSSIHDSIRYGAVPILKRTRPYLSPFIIPLLFPKELKERAETHARRSRERARKRIQMGSLNRQDFFSHLIKEDKIKEGELMADAQTLVEAGTLTTAGVLTALVYYVLCHAEAMAKLIDEIRGAFTSSDQIMNDSTTGLKYLNGVIEESLRLFPPLSISLPRECPGAMIDGHYIPEGVIVCGNIYNVARDPRYWYDPEGFRPERWIGDPFGDDKRASLPFSLGTRSCIGVNLAYLELRVTVAKMFYTYDLELVSKDIGDWNRACKCYALWTMPELLVKFHPRAKS